jgi:predicted transcriptional regulator
MDFNEDARHLAAEIVSKYVGNHKLATTELPELIATVHKAIRGLGKPLEPERALLWYRCDNPSAKTMWSAWNVAIGD